MSLSIGIVGLPNVGKSTLFNALVKQAQAKASNFPFCTIDPNVGVVTVPDERLEKLAAVSKSKKIVPTVVEFVDVAGLVAGAHKGEGLGNQFLSHIRECDAIAHVVRFFKDSNITHVHGDMDPKKDINTVNIELILSDISMVEKKIFSLQKEVKAKLKEAIKKEEILKKILAVLEKEKFASELNLEPDDKKLIADTNLITLKPMLIIANISENDAKITGEELIKKFNMEELVKKEQLITISAKIESELIDLDEKETVEYLESLNLDSSGLNRLIKAAYKTLSLITFLTSGEMESRAWTVTKESNATTAAGKIHTDFEKKFVAVDVVKYQDFIEIGGWPQAYQKGKVKTQGRNYIINDGDVVIFKHG